jgi:alkylated DNA repair dioxygenase AlkB
MSNLSIIADFISPTEEQQLLDLITLYPGKDRKRKSGPSRMIRFGQVKLTDGLIDDKDAAAHGYKGRRRSYAAMNDGYDVAVKEVPELLASIAERVVAAGLLDKVPPIFVINKYPPGYKISRHIDHVDNGPTIPVLGINSDATMMFTKIKERVHHIQFNRRSLVTISGKLRYEWMHEILPCKDLRYSLVFRNLPE